MAMTWVNHVTADDREKVPPTIAIYGQDAAPLANVQPNESIYVLAHGIGNADWVANTSIGAVLISPTQLAKHLNGAGLPLGHRKLKLYICNTNGTMRAFATRVHQVLAGKYMQIQVQYYLGSVSLPRLVPETAMYQKRSTFTGMPDPNTGFVLVNDGPGARASAVRQTV